MQFSNSNKWCSHSFRTSNRIACKISWNCWRGNLFVFILSSLFYSSILDLALVVSGAWLGKASCECSGIANLNPNVLEFSTRTCRYKIYVFQWIRNALTSYCIAHRCFHHRLWCRSLYARNDQLPSYPSVYIHGRYPLLNWSWFILFYNL